MTIEVSTEKPACWGCFHYSGQFSTVLSNDRCGYCHYDRNMGGQGEQFVEADHYCKRFTLLNPEMPTTLADAVADCKDWLDGITEDDCNTEYTVAEMLAENWETPEEAIRIAFDNADVLDWRIALFAEWRTIRGDGWGAYYGPTPDEHYGEIAVIVYDHNGKEVFDINGSDEDCSGGEAVHFLLNEFFGASV